MLLTASTSLLPPLALAVTIFGESAGASLVETHLVAPKSDGLFHRGIMQSGPFDNYTVQLDPELGFSYFASAANCTGADDDAVLACLKGKPIWCGRVPV